MRARARAHVSRADRRAPPLAGTTDNQLPMLLGRTLHACVDAAVRAATAGERERHSLHRTRRAHMTTYW